MFENTNVVGGKNSNYVLTLIVGCFKYVNVKYIRFAEFLLVHSSEQFQMIRIKMNEIKTSRVPFPNTGVSF